MEKELNAFPLISGARHGSPRFPLLSNIVLEVVGKTVRHTDKEMKENSAIHNNLKKKEKKKWKKKTQNRKFEAY